MTSVMRFQINAPKVIHEAFDDEVVIVNLGNGNYYSLGKVGADIWGLIERGATVGDIVEGLVRRYEGSRDEIEQAVHALMSDLQKDELIVPLAAQGSERAQEGQASAEHEPAAGRLPFEAPVLQTYTDMQELMLLDPIHEVDEAGWPSTKPEPPDEKS